MSSELPNPTRKRRRRLQASPGTRREPSSTTATTTPVTVGVCETVSHRYEKVGRIGEGTYGVVYSAIDKTKRRIGSSVAVAGGTGRGSAPASTTSTASASTTHMVALKRCLPHHESSDGFPVTTLREINALRVCSQHPNVVNLLQVAVSGTSPNGVFLVFEYCQQDVAQILDTHYVRYHGKKKKTHSTTTRPSSSLSSSSWSSSSSSPFTEAEVKTLTHQLLSALEFCHSHYLIHRDIKPSNLLYKFDDETNSGILKLADFGLSRHCTPPPLSSSSSSMMTTMVTTTTMRQRTSLDDDYDYSDNDRHRHQHHNHNVDPRMTPNVVSLWYRAPELMLKAAAASPRGGRDNHHHHDKIAPLLDYSFPIDLWAVGCVVAELYLGRPLLDGQSELDQLHKMVQCLGPPPSRIYEQNNNWSEKSNLPASSGTLSVGLWDRFDHLSTGGGLTLLTGLLEYDPNERWTASRALSSDYFVRLPPLMATRLPKFDGH